MRAGFRVTAEAADKRGHTERTPPSGGGVVSAAAPGDSVAWQAAPKSLSKTL